MRILCLHGMGTNSEVLEMQTAALRQQLGEPPHVFEFLEGVVPWPAAAGLSDIFPSNQEYFAYYDTRASETIITALNDLESWVTDNGPFDGVLGFSQGAAFAAMLLIRQHRASNALAFRFGIFICAAQPLDVDFLHQGDVRPQDIGDDDPLIRIPTTHIIGANDPDQAYSRALSQLCEERSKVLFIHSGGHEIPRTPKEVTSEMAHAINNIMIKAEFRQ